MFLCSRIQPQNTSELLTNGQCVMRAEEALNSSSGCRQKKNACKISRIIDKIFTVYVFEPFITTNNGDLSTYNSRLNSLTTALPPNKTAIWSVSTKLIREEQITEELKERACSLENRAQLPEKYRSKDTTRFEIFPLINDKICCFDGKRSFFAYLMVFETEPANFKTCNFRSQGDQTNIHLQ